jgi:hypothetical protein
MALVWRETESYMEVAQGQNWGCSAKEKQMALVIDTVIKDKSMFLFSCPFF